MVQEALISETRAMTAQQYHSHDPTKGSNKIITSSHWYLNVGTGEENTKKVW